MSNFLPLGAGFEQVSVSLCILDLPIAVFYCKYLCCAFYHNVLLSRSSKAEFYFQGILSCDHSSSAGISVDITCPFFHLR